MYETLKLQCLKNKKEMNLCIQKRNCKGEMYVTKAIDIGNSEETFTNTFGAKFCKCRLCDYTGVRRPEVG